MLISPTKFIKIVNILGKLDEITLLIIVLILNKGKIKTKKNEFILI